MVTKSNRSTGALHALQAHVADEPGDEALRERLAELTSNRTVKLSPRGQLLIWRKERGVWALGGASTALIFAHVYNGEEPAALELAALLEEKVVGIDGKPFPFAARNIHVRVGEWRSQGGDGLQAAITLVQADYDEAHCTGYSSNVVLAAGIRAARAEREEIARRCAEGGYVTDPPDRLVKGDNVEFDVRRWSQYHSPFAGDDPPRGGETVTLQGTLSGHPQVQRESTTVPFVRGTLTWSTPDGRHGPVKNGRFNEPEWVFASGRAVYRDHVIFRRRHPDIESAGIGAWTTSMARELGEAYGMSEQQLALLEAAVADAGTHTLWGGLYTQYAREAAADYHRAKPAILDTAGMQVRASLDEYAARGEIALRMERGDVSDATLLAAVAAERRRRRLGTPNPDYLRGPVVAEALRAGTAAVPELSRTERRGALDYATERAAAAARARLGSWDERTKEIAADLARWRQLSEQLTGVRRARR